MRIRGEWRPRSAAFVVIQAGLAWIGASYGLNLVIDDGYRRFVSPATLDSVESVAPLHLFGWALIAGSVLLAVGMVMKWPLFSSFGHLILAILFVSLGVSVFQIDYLNQVFLVMGLVLHPTMATALARDVGKAVGERDIRK